MMGTIKIPTSIYFPIEEIKKQMEEEKEFYFASYLERWIKIANIMIIKMW